jgi:predicted RNase H-like nuclease (RuvC/YqgF family)
MTSVVFVSKTMAAPLSPTSPAQPIDAAVAKEEPSEEPPADAFDPRVFQKALRDIETQRQAFENAEKENKQLRKDIAAQRRDIEALRRNEKNSASDDESAVSNKKTKTHSKRCL